MEGVFSRLGWFLVAAVLVTYVTSLIAGGIVSAQASGQNEPVLVRDELQANSHRLSGMIMVPTPCDELSVNTSTLSPTSYLLSFETWREPSVNCPQDSTPREFQTTLFAPATGVYFTATLNGAAFPIGVVPVISGDTP